MTLLSKIKKAIEEKKITYRNNTVYFDDGIHAVGGISAKDNDELASKIEKVCNRCDFNGKDYFVNLYN